MTEQEWLNCTDPTPMLGPLRGKVSDRKLRLFAVACCDRLWPFLVQEQSWCRAVETGEAFAEGATTAKQQAAARRGVCVPVASDAFARVLSNIAKAVVKASASDAAQDSNHGAACSAGWAQLAAARNQGIGEDEARTGFEQAFRLEKELQATVLRCVFGNFFRPVSVDTAWLTSTVVALAHGIYTGKAFDRMPILADALQDAGCDNADILAHCRDTHATHARGCWVVDLLTGRE